MRLNIRLDGRQGVNEWPVDLLTSPYPNTIECKENDPKLTIPHHKNVNKKKNHLTSEKLESKKQDKKVMAVREDSGGHYLSNCRENPRPTNNLIFYLQHLSTIQV